MEKRAIAICKASGNGDEETVDVSEEQTKTRSFVRLTILGGIGGGVRSYCSRVAWSCFRGG